MTSRVQKNPGYLKKPNPLDFWGVLLGLWPLVGFGFFVHLNEQLGSLLVDLAHQLSFYLDLPVP